MNEEEVKAKIYTTFANTAAGLGYSEVHGRIIACLLINENPVPLSVIAKETGYSSSMISLSLDFLESLDMIKRVKRPGDRRLYIAMNGDLLNGLKRAILMKLEKSIVSSTEEFEQYRKEIRAMPDGEKLLRKIDVLEKEIKRLDRYVRLLSKIRLP